MDTRKCFWFGTIERSGWFATPLRGADSSPEGWGVNGTLLNGGGWGLHSWNTHKTFTYDWPSTSSPEVAQLMKSYRDGTYGRGLLYFLEPLWYTRNIFPASWADPSLALGDEGGSHIYGIQPTAMPTSSAHVNDLPIQSASYQMPFGSPQPGFRGAGEAVFLPIPEGHTLYLGANYQFTGTGGVFYSEVTTSNQIVSTEKLTPLSTTGPVVQDTIPWRQGLAGVYVWIGKLTTASSSVTVSALTARLIETRKIASQSHTVTYQKWVGGQGHSGCRFNGSPSYITNGPIDGGRIGFAASFIEVGSWVYG